MAKFPWSKESQLNAHGTPSAEKFHSSPIVPSSYNDRQQSNAPSMQHHAPGFACLAVQRCLVWELSGKSCEAGSEWPRPEMTFEFPVTCTPCWLIHTTPHPHQKHPDTHALVSLLDSLLEWQVFCIYTMHVGRVDSWNKILVKNQYEL